MPRPLFVIVLLLLALLAVPRSSNATTVNFDEIAGSGVRGFAGDRYQGSGVRFSTPGAGLFVFAATYTNTIPNYLYGSSSASGSLADQAIIMDFVVPGTTMATSVDQVSFYVVDVDTGAGSIWQASAFDLTNTLLQTVSGNLNGQVLVSFGNLGLHRIVFSPSIEDEGIDSLTFQSVPEPPTSLILFAILVAWLVWRKTGVVRMFHYSEKR